ncbi:MAG: hypothetical protein LBT59_15385 [Clostridiales bacterium]|nr:hypothetical protein [Clostridiales bacterium]
MEEYDLSLTEKREFLKSYGLHTDEEVEEREKEVNKVAIRKMFSKNKSVDEIADYFPKELVLEVQDEKANGEA